MSNPWQNLMPGGVAFTPRPDEDDDWGHGAPGDPVGDSITPLTVPTTPVPEVSTNVDTTVQPHQPDDTDDGSDDDNYDGDFEGDFEGDFPDDLPADFADLPDVEVPDAATLPVEQTPAWSAWGGWDDEDEQDTPAPADPISALLAPGQWATTTEAPATPATEAPMTEVPVAEVPAVEVAAAQVPLVEVPATPVAATHPATPHPATPHAVTPPTLAPATPVAEAHVTPVAQHPVAEVPATPVAVPAPVQGHPLPQPHPSVPPLHDPVLPSTPTPVPAPVPAPTPVPVPVPVPAPVSVEEYVPEGHSVNPTTGELTPLTPVAETPAVQVPATPAAEHPLVAPPTAVPFEAPVEAPVEVAAEVAVEVPVDEPVPTTPEGYWLNPFTMRVEPKPAPTPDAADEHVDEHVDERAGEPPVVEVSHEAPVVEVPAVEVPASVVPEQAPEHEVVQEVAQEVEQGSAPTAGTSLLATVASVDELLEADDDFSDVEEAEAAAEAAAREEKKRQTRATRPVAVTDRDVAVLQFLARYRMATYPQLAAAFSISYTALRHRMPRLAREGLVVRKAIGKSAYSVWMPTDAGMKVADMDLTLPTLSWATVAHTLGLVDIGIRFEALGEVVVTEREIRAADTRDQPTDRMHQAAELTGFTGEQARLYVVQMGEGTKQYAHIPDMVLARPPAENGGARSVAVELELTHKPSAQWRKILTAYLNAPHISQVIYFTHQSKVRSGILQAAKEVGAEHIVGVRKFVPSEDSAIPLPGRA